MLITDKRLYYFCKNKEKSFFINVFWLEYDYQK